MTSARDNIRTGWCNLMEKAEAFYISLTFNKSYDNTVGLHSFLPLL